MKVVTIIQPAYLPWLGFFDRVSKADLFISLDHVALDANSKTKFATRNKIRTQNGWNWLSVPILSKGNYQKLFLNQIEIDNTQKWAHKHWQAIRHNYSKSKYFADYAPFLDEIYAQSWHLLDDLTSVINHFLFQRFGITTAIERSSTLNVAGAKNQLILNLCAATNATTYLSGPFGRDYLNAEDFQRVNIEIRYHDFVHPVYTQNYPGFEPYMSAIDLLFNHGPDAKKILAGPEPSTIL
jgi:WbqC-like protein family